jgi:hypothetical protein
VIAPSLVDVEVELDTFIAAVNPHPDPSGQNTSCASYSKSPSFVTIVSPDELITRKA